MPKIPAIIISRHNAPLSIEIEKVYMQMSIIGFREGNYYPSSCLSKIDDRHVESLVKHMIQKDPSKRYTAEQYLSKWKVFRYRLMPYMN